MDESLTNADQSGRSSRIHRHSKQFDDVKCIPLQNQESHQLLKQSTFVNPNIYIYIL
ncbi:hypothetical protein PFDG_02057 [Plasmodium falciparum Dd2]|uniref:Uncharacterized protein n=1 Tax=Plasmodium falciparum (isolate Dd2) TaxID=57267 RepID=A0A0L7M0T5_PLAF4|nr:hypothetical protein PFDG_02057 [Plasmodium falciparum Dd2]